MRTGSPLVMHARHVLEKSPTDCKWARKPNTAGNTDRNVNNPSAPMHSTRVKALSSFVPSNRPSSVRELVEPLPAKMAFSQTLQESRVKSRTLDSWSANIELGLILRWSSCLHHHSRSSRSRSFHDPVLHYFRLTIATTLGTLQCWHRSRLRRIIFQPHSRHGRRLSR
jgi:hypothetical protein